MQYEITSINRLLPIQLIEDRMEDIHRYAIGTMAEKYGALKSISSDSQLKNLDFESEKLLTESIITYKYKNKISATLIFSKTYKNLSFTVYFSDIVDNLPEICKELHSIFPESFLNAHPQKNKERYKILSKYTNYTSSDYYFVADNSAISIYPSSDWRKNYFLDIPDSFYENIPAYKVEKLKNDICLVQLYKNPYGDGQEEALAIKKAVEYYKQELIKLDLWQKIKWTPHWRETYKDLLTEKGFDV